MHSTFVNVLQGYLLKPLSKMSKTFLAAEWRKLVMANYAIDKKILEPYLPSKTEFDFWNNTCYVSIVGFMFLDTKLKGISIPFHTQFEEVNLRFYVRYLDNGTWKRGVTFIKEIVPKPALTFVANAIYKEKYETMPMAHSHRIEKDKLHVEYKWKKEKWHSISISASTSIQPILIGREEEFITEHYWGYTKLPDNRTSEYGVEHPKWEVYPTLEYSIDVDFGLIYGSDFACLNTQKPKSVFLAEGSNIRVKSGIII